MPKPPNTKRRLIEVLKLLFEQTDATHGLTLMEIATSLEELGISCERKSLYSDVETLRECGIEVAMHRRGGKTDYALERRPLSFRNLSLLVDSVQSSPFLTDDLAAEVCEDLGALASVHERGRLAGQIEVPGRVHMANEQVFETIAVLREAMRERKQVSFRYFTYDEKKERSYHTYRGSGERRELTPVKLIYVDGIYYLVVWEPWYEKIAYYRVDRMSDVAVSGEDGVRNPTIANYSVARDESVGFGLFDAERETVTLLLEPYFVNALIDKFGHDVRTYPQEDGRVKAYVTVTLSPGFLGWIFSLHGCCTIAGPKSAIEKYRSYVDDALAWLNDEVPSTRSIKPSRED